MAKKKTTRTNIKDPIEKELDAIKKLLMLFLVKTGVTQDELASTLQMDQSDISRTIKTRKIKRYKDT